LEKQIWQKVYPFKLNIYKKVGHRNYLYIEDLFFKNRIQGCYTNLLTTPKTYIFNEYHIHYISKYNCINENFSNIIYKTSL